MHRGDLPRCSYSRNASATRSSSQRLPATRNDATRGVPTATSAADSGVGAERDRAATSGAVAATQSKRPYIRIVTERRREQCRQSQARYRRRQNVVEVDLEIEVQRLRLEILHLEARRRVLHHASSVQERCIYMLEELCRVFRMGVRSADTAASDQGNHEQVAFVVTHFHPNAQINGRCGRDILLQKMEWLSTAFDDFELVMLRCRSLGKSESSATIQMDQRLCVTVSEATIRLVFPHLNAPEQYRLKRKLLGKRLELNASTLVVCDEDSHVIVWDSSIAFVIVLQRILALEEAADVLGQARLDPSGWLLLPATSAVRVDAEFVEEEKPEPKGVETNEEQQPRRDEETTSENPRDSRPFLLQRDNGDCSGGFLIHDGLGDDYVML